VLDTAPGEQVRLALDTADALPVDDQAWVTVPGPDNTPPSETVTLVGVPTDAVAVARAFAAVPGVKLRLRTPTTYRSTDALHSALTILDGWVPKAGLPPSPSVLLIDPPSLPQGHVGARLRDSVVSGSDQRSGLLSGVDLTSLSIDAGDGRVLTLPRYLTAAAWSPDGPLLAAGDDGSRRVAVLSFDPAQSDLPQLASFPILAANLVGWSARWAPAAAAAGDEIRIAATPGTSRLAVAEPGLYTVTEAGAAVRRTTTVAVSVAPPSSAPTSTVPVDLTFAAAGATPSQGPNEVPWLLAAALVVMTLEWTYWRVRLTRTALA
jgi:hypothetical protein